MPASCPTASFLGNCACLPWFLLYDSCMVLLCYLDMAYVGCYCEQVVACFRGPEGVFPLSIHSPQETFIPFCQCKLEICRGLCFGVHCSYGTHLISILHGAADACAGGCNGISQLTRLQWQFHGRSDRGCSEWGCPGQWGQSGAGHHHCDHQGQPTSQAPGKPSVSIIPSSGVLSRPGQMRGHIY